MGCGVCVFQRVCVLYTHTHEDEDDVSTCVRVWCVCILDVVVARVHCRKQYLCMGCGVCVFYQVYVCHTHTHQTHTHQTHTHQTHTHQNVDNVSTFMFDVVCVF